MSLKMDWRKLTAILPKVNKLLCVLAAAAALYCGVAAVMLLTLPNAQTLTEASSQQQEQIASLQTQLQQQRRVTEQAELDAGVALSAAQHEKADMQADCDAAAEQKTQMETRIENFENGDANIEQLKLDIAAIRTEYGQAIRKLEDKILAGESQYKICYLTFDDGPSYLTPKFLDKIDELDIKVTFFTIGVQMAKHKYDLRDELLRREALGGHTIANHTYTHSIHGSLYKSQEAFIEAVQQQDELVYSVTGMHTDIVRFPAGSYYSPYRTATIEQLAQLGYGWIDWSANAYDSGTNVNSSASTATAVIRQVRQEQISVVLCHDWRQETLGALDRIVTTLKSEGYLFLPLFKESWTVGNVRPKWD